jgi:hypothetical protein
MAEKYLVQAALAMLCLTVEGKMCFYHPTMVMGCAMPKRIRLAMLKSRNRLDIRAIASWTALIAVSL